MSEKKKKKIKEDPRIRFYTVTINKHKNGVEFREITLDILEVLGPIVGSVYFYIKSVSHIETIGDNMKLLVTIQLYDPPE